MDLDIRKLWHIIVFNGYLWRILLHSLSLTICETSEIHSETHFSYLYFMGVKWEQLPISLQVLNDILSSLSVAEEYLILIYWIIPGSFENTQVYYFYVYFSLWFRNVGLNLRSWLLNKYNSAFVPSLETPMPNEQDHKSLPFV